MAALWVSHITSSWLSLSIHVTRVPVWVLSSGSHSCIPAVRLAVFSSKAQGQTKPGQVIGNMWLLQAHHRIRTLSSTAQYPAVDFVTASRGGAGLNETCPHRMIFLFLNSESADKGLQFHLSSPSRTLAVLCCWSTSLIPASPCLGLRTLLALNNGHFFLWRPGSGAVKALGSSPPGEIPVADGCPLCLQGQGEKESLGPGFF